MKWNMCRDELPPIWKWVNVSTVYGSYIGYRAIGGWWKSKSGLKEVISFHDHWTDLKE